MLTAEQIRIFQEYKKNKKRIFSDRIIQSFFQDGVHIELLILASDGNSDAQKQIEEKFLRHYFRIRFINYVSSTIKFYTIGQQRALQKYDTRSLLVLDKPISENGITLKDSLESKHSSYKEGSINADPKYFLESFTNSLLEEAFQLLTEKQKIIATLCYALSFQDNEIAKMIKVSPQAIGKTRNLALRKLKIYMTERR
ncbi:hypothetical protein ACFO9Q_03370 [Paenibacillus sp. GCM10023252]|uniref:hypothetical protein n=1 Tax=Paenibacillus sp. GCM10023252 TaxID=3252649 RepID=UPI003623965A